MLRRFSGARPKRIRDAFDAFAPVSQFAPGRRGPCCGSKRLYFAYIGPTAANTRSRSEQRNPWERREFRSHPPDSNRRPADYAFDKAQGLSEHTAPFDALVQVLDGVAEITIGGVPHRLGKDEMILMPANVPHALKAVERFKMMLVMIREATG